MTATLDRYLTVEGVLNEFFAAFDYCYPECVRREKERNAHRPVAACCTKKYYALYDEAHPSYDHLRSERERLYGRPSALVRPRAVSPCEYHDPDKGCILATHKSPICLAYLCPAAIERLRTRHAIFTYDYLGVYHALDWLLVGVLPAPALVEFEQSIRAMTHAIRKAYASRTPA